MAINPKQFENWYSETKKLSDYYLDKKIIVLIDKSLKESSYRVDRCVNSSQIEPTIIKGQQLVFDFMYKQV